MAFDKWKASGKDAKAVRTLLSICCDALTGTGVDSRDAFIASLRSTANWLEMHDVQDNPDCGLLDERNPDDAKV